MAVCLLPCGKKTQKICFLSNFDDLDSMRVMKIRNIISDEYCNLCSFQIALTAIVLCELV